MKTFINISILVLLFVGCDSEKSKNQPDSNTMIDKSIDKHLIYSVDIVQKDTIEIIRHSDAFNKFFQRIKNDGYNIDTILMGETMFNSFDRKSGFNDTLKSIRVSNVNERYYKLRRKHPTVKGGDTYPRFNLTEFYFDDENKAKTIKLSIDSIINCTDRIDLRNEKTYDYCVQFSNRIIYVGCNSMHLSTYSNNYKTVIEDLVE